MNKKNLCIVVAVISSVLLIMFIKNREITSDEFVDRTEKYAMTYPSNIDQASTEEHIEVCPATSVPNEIETFRPAPEMTLPPEEIAEEPSYNNSIVSFESNCINTKEEKEKLGNLLLNCNTKYSGGYISGITGVIKNKTYKNAFDEDILKYWNFVQIDFELFNSEGEYLCSVSAKNDKGIAVGQEWEFDIPVEYFYKATKYKVIGISPW